MYIISGCLLGHNCKYNGGNNRNEDVIKFCKNKKYVVICPESAGKLPQPRPPAERIGDRIIDREGRDVTEAFCRGAEISMKISLTAAAREGETIEGAILKANSPSCGSGKIYDGTFTGSLTSGDGVFTEMLKKKNIRVITEHDREKLAKWISEGDVSRLQRQE